MSLIPFYVYAYMVSLIWAGHALFHEHTNKKYLVKYLELKSLKKIR